jgi:hypothetical protein
LDPNPDPDPLLRGTDPRIRIRTEMSRNPNTGFSSLCSRPCIRPICEQEGQDHGADVCHAEELCRGPQDSPGGNEGECHALIFMWQSCKRMFCTYLAAGHKTLLEGMKVCVMHWFSCGSHAKGCFVYLAAGHKTLLEGMKVCVMHWFSCVSHAKRMFCIYLATGHKTLLEGMKVCVMHWFSCDSHAKGCSAYRYLATGHKTLLEGMKVCVMHWFSCVSHAKRMFCIYLARAIRLSWR